mmetsp:Transcript_20862/g.29437  ORF Transcript_20862/g.29437 Transcript_20862/m.29437 type:complete len:200 (+) Transcript_20862:205-804(+)
MPSLSPHRLAIDRMGRMAGKEMMKAVMRNEKIEVNRNGMVIVGHAGMVGRMQKKLLIHLSPMTRGHPIRKRIDKKIRRPRKTGRIDDNKMTRIPCLVNPGLERVTAITRDAEGRKTLRRRRQVLQAQVHLPLRATVTALIMVGTGGPNVFHIERSQLIIARMSRFPRLTIRPSTIASLDERYVATRSWLEKRGLVLLFN